ncbi:MAG: hypothetical protein FJ265_15835 [Planctomycetes bacterium]|nr:hypothetical protein [Planctomycetota bacterium]
MADPAATGESELREALARAEDPCEPALELVGLLAAAERHREALAVLATARRRSSDSRLAVAQAAVHRDLGERHLAVRELEQLEAGSGSMPPGVLFELAELQWLEGCGPAALATASRLRAAHAGSPWLEANDGALRVLEHEVASRAEPCRILVRDLLGNLRGARDTGIRLATLEALWQIGDPAARGDGSTLRWRVLAIACGDETAAVRARAVELAEPGLDDPLGFCQAALGDGSPAVRATAARNALRLLGAGAVPLLAAALVEESQPEAFCALHDALVDHFGPVVALAPGDAHAAAGRAAAVAAWRRRWGP